MTCQLALISDDLTGALDSSAPFAARGLLTEVVLGDMSIPFSPGIEIAAVSTGTREGSAAAAAERTAAAIERIKPLEPQRYFKKIDSRVKGFVAEELAAMLRHVARSSALVCPAVPTAGRIVRSGSIEGEGVATAISLAARFAPILAHCEIVNAKDEEELARIAQRLVADRSVIGVGARGLADALARQMVHSAAARVMPPRGPLLICCGTRDPITLAQLGHLASVHAVPIRSAVGGHLQDVTPGGGTLVVQFMPDGSSDPKHQLRRFGEEVASRLLGRFTTVLATGGETAQAILAPAGVSRLRVLGDYLPGVPVCRFNNGQAFITKSGGFGDEAVLSRLIDCCT